MNMQNPDFYNYSRLGETRNPDNENPPFAWPGVRIKNINGPLGIDSVKMARGFMRSILTDPEIVSAFNNPTQARQTSINNNPGHYRLNFQFNPEYIERSVAQTPGAVNPILQSMSNLTQPIPGSATFNFTMTFNREMEVAAAGNRADSQLLWEGDDIDPDSKRLKDPGLVGVWADLHMFDLIVGQGITEELLDLVAAFTEVQAIERSANESTTTDGEGEEPKEGEEKEEKASETDPDAITFDKDEFTTNFKANFGNSAFLNPLPVRIVFSDTFMVEGMVTGTSVAFQKFNHRMIPTICQINVNFSAMYLGFAKKNAFLTDNLKAWAKDQAKEIQDNIITDQSNSRIAANAVSFVNLYPNNKINRIPRMGEGQLTWSGKNNPDKETNLDQFLVHSLSNAKSPNTTTYYPETPTTLEHWYNIKKTFLYKDGVNITNSVLSLYSDSRFLPFVITVLYNKKTDVEKEPTYNFKIELVYKYPNPETGLRGTELKSECTFVKTGELYYKQYLGPYIKPSKIITPMVYAAEGTLDLGKLPNLPKINSALIGTENIPYNDNPFLGLRVTTSVAILGSDGTSEISTDLKPIDYLDISWPSSHYNTQFNVSPGIKGTATVVDDANAPKDRRPPDRLEP
jgi:hypothetical protein